MDPLNIFGGLVRQFQGRPSGRPSVQQVNVKDLGNRQTPKALPTSALARRSVPARPAAVGGLARLLVVPALVDAVPRAVEAGIGLVEAGENILRPVVDAGLGIAKAQQQLNNEAAYVFNRLTQGQTPYGKADQQSTRPVGSQATLNGRPVTWNGQRWTIDGAPASPITPASGTPRSPEAPAKSNRSAQLAGAETPETPWSSGSQESAPAGFNPAAASPPSIQSGFVGTTPAVPPVTPLNAPATAADVSAAVALTTARQQQAQSQLAQLAAQLGSTQDVSNLAFQPTAPEQFRTMARTTIAPTLEQYYGAQDVYGKKVFNEQSAELNGIIEQLGYDENMKQWALANPMLAQREYVKMLTQTGANPALQTPAGAAGVNGRPPGMGLAGNVIDNPIT